MCRLRYTSIQAYMGHKNIYHTVRYTELSPGSCERISGGTEAKEKKAKAAGSEKPAAPTNQLLTTASISFFTSSMNGCTLMVRTPGSVAVGDNSTSTSTTTLLPVR